jgi:hypothetical protein
MTDLGVLRCPNCGGLLKDKNAEKCEYCGAVLTGRDKRERGPKFRPHEGEVVYFKNLPDKTITIDTFDIPFEPDVTYENLPTGRLDISRRLDAEQIINLVKNTQKACNEEDLDLYMSTISESAESFYKLAKKGATEQFITGDMKRYTKTIEFKQLTDEEARINVTIETIIFMESGRTNQLEVTFGWFIRKEGNNWKVYNSAHMMPKIFSKIESKGSSCLIVTIAVIISIVIGVSVFIYFMISSQKESIEKTIKKSSYSIEVEKKSEEIFKDHNIIVEKGTQQNPLILYKEPEIHGQPHQVIINPGDYEILDKEGEWVYIRTEEGQKGWTLKQLLKGN